MAAVGLIGLLAPFLVFGATAEDQGARPYKPPTISFPADGIDLLGAVRLALAHSPDIYFQQASAEFQGGVAQEQRGAFDFTLGIDASLEYREQELTQARKDDLQDERDTLDQGIEEGEQEIAANNQLLHDVALARADPNFFAFADEELRLQMKVLNALIAQADDPTPFINARNNLLTLEADKAIAANAEAEDALQKARTRRADIGETPDDEYAAQAKLLVQGSDLFRNGILVTPFVDGQGQRENFVGKPQDAAHGGKGVADLFIFRAGVGAVFPLLRGRGRDATGALEQAAKLDHEAQLQLVQHQSSISALTITSTYWDARAAQELVDVAKHSVELQRRLEEISEAVIADDKMAPVEIARARASRSSAEARLEDAERRLYQARVDLALAMGIAVSDDPASLPASRDPFPEVAGGSLDDATLAKQAADALNQRQDLAAARTVVSSGKVLVRGAQTDTRARLDLETTAWMTALGDVSVGNALDRWVGPSGKVAVSFEKPFGNNFFEGRLAQREADLSQRDIDLADLERRIRLEIVRAARSLEIVAERVRQADAAVGYYRTTIDAEVQKLQEGESSLIDTIITEDQQTSALNEQVLARQEYAKLVARLRFEVGSLIQYDGDHSTVTRDALVTPPWNVPRPGAGP